MAKRIEIPLSAVEAISEILGRGSDAEVKRIGGMIHVIEISRKLRVKSDTPSTGTSGDANRGE